MWGLNELMLDTSGYVQKIGLNALIRIATKHDLILRIDCRPGLFVTAGECMVSVYPSGRVTDAVADSIRGGLVIGRSRTVDQDLKFSIWRIVELAQRSLSPGINDPTIAIYCIDRLGEVFGRMSRRDVPSPIHLDKNGQLRIKTEVENPAELVCHAISAIARYGISEVDVVKRLVHLMDKLSLTLSPQRLKVLPHLVIKCFSKERATLFRALIAKKCKNCSVATNSEAHAL